LFDGDTVSVSDTVVNRNRILNGYGLGRRRRLSSPQARARKMRWVAVTALLAAVAAGSGLAAAGPGDAVTPEFTAKVGAWSIVGQITPSGTGYGCMMVRAAGSPGSFAYLAATELLSLQTMAAVMVPTDLPSGTPIKMMMAFNHDPLVPAPGEVRDGWAQLDFAKFSPAFLAKGLELLQNSTRITIAVTPAGGKTVTTAADLAGSQAAYRQVAQCMQRMLDTVHARATKGAPKRQ